MNDRSDEQVANDTERALVQLARRAVERYVLERVVIPAPTVLTPAMLECAGVFVSIKKRGELRGCIGTFEPTHDSVAEEIIHNAISAATRDPRFPPVHREELLSLRYSVDVLSQPVPVLDLALLEPRRYGVIVVKGGRRGLLLPDLEGVDTVAQQLEIARKKAGIFPGESAEILSFEVRRYQ